MASAGEQFATSLSFSREMLRETPAESYAKLSQEQVSVLQDITTDISLPPKEIPEYISPHAARAVCMIRSRRPEELPLSVRTYFHNVLEVCEIGKQLVGANTPFTVLPVPESFRSPVALHLVNWYTYQRSGFVREKYSDICKLTFPDKETVEATSDDKLVLRALVSAMADFDQAEPIDLRQSQALNSLTWLQNKERSQQGHLPL